MPLHECLYWLLNMSIAGSLTGLIVWLIGRWRRVPRRLAHGLWALALIRLWIPVGLKSPLSIFNLLPEDVITSVPYLNSQSMGMYNSIQLAHTYAPFTYRSQAILAVFRAASAVWLAGATALAAVMVIRYVCGVADTRRAQRLQDGVYLSDRVTTPAVYGVIAPMILIPRAMSGRDLAPIIAHEQAHIRRLDNLWRLIALATACLHWFNPCVWWMLRAFLRETELACDESVIARLNETERLSYARALVDAAETRLTLVSPFGGRSLTGRIERVLSFRHLSVAGAAAFLLLAAALAFVLLTNRP